MKNIFIYLVLVFILNSCKDEKKEIVGSNKLKVVSNEKLLKGWRTLDIDSIKVNIPSSWEPQKLNDVLLYFPLNDNKANMYFIALKTDISVTNVKNYLKEVFKQMEIKDKKFTYLLTKINLKNNTSFYIIDFYSKEKGINYKSYCLIYEIGNQIYDFSYKTLDDTKTNAKNYQTFYTVLFSFEYKYDNIIAAEKFIINDTKILRYEDL